MIPKIIHYCWFGGNPIPKNLKNYIDGWKEKLSGYEIIEWNENNFDIASSVQYVKEAYEAKNTHLSAITCEYGLCIIMAAYILIQMLRC